MWPTRLSIISKYINSYYNMDIFKGDKYILHLPLIHDSAGKINNRDVSCCIHRYGTINLFENRSSKIEIRSCTNGFFPAMNLLKIGLFASRTI